MSHRYHSVSVALLLCGLPGLLLLNNWRMGGVGALADDLIYYLPVRAYVGEQLRSGHLPLWNPYIHLGAPLAADPQAGLWYPATWLFAVLPPVLAYSAGLWSHYALAGWGMYRFLRCLRRHRSAALLGAIAFEFSPYLVAHRQHLTIVQACAWLPWIFWAWQRYADTGRRKHVAVAAVFLGLQLLVQHMQPTLIGLALLAAYAVFVLARRRRTVLAWLPLWVAGGVALAAVQMIPTWYLFMGSSRGTPGYHLFIENSWVLSSALLLLFPMLYGSSTPNLWSERWWGISHLCEQWCYPTLIVLSLALATVVLLKRRRDADANPMNTANGSGGGAIERVHVRFWWGACLAALLIALGGATPLAKVLFHVPVYKSLRVPARWLIVWSFAWPVLASFSLHLLLMRAPRGERVAWALRRMWTRVLPALVFTLLVILWLGPVWTRGLGGGLQSGAARELLAHWRPAVRWTNPALLVPLAMMILTAGVTLRWLRTRRPAGASPLLCLLLIDLAIVTPWIEVDLETYRVGDITRKPRLLAHLNALGLQAGDRILVPRRDASYHRPLEILWPDVNTMHGVATLNGYGPLADARQRLLLRFMPWGASEEIIALLRDPELLRRLGVRFVVARDPQERDTVDWARRQDDAINPATPVEDAAEVRDVPSSNGLLWQVQVGRPGLYELELDAEPITGTASRWFVRLESDDHQHELAPTHAVEPADLLIGPRRLCFLFDTGGHEAGAAWIRVKSEMGVAVRAGHATFRRVARAADKTTFHRLSNHLKPVDSPPGNIAIYEVAHPRPLVSLATVVRSVANLPAALDELLRNHPPAEVSIVEGALDNAGSLEAAPGVLKWERPFPELLAVRAEVKTPRLLQFNESWESGWLATVDGQTVEPLRVDVLTQGVWLSAGEHTVTFRYWPRGLSTGMMLSGVGWGIVLMGGLAKTIFHAYRKRRQAADLNQASSRFSC